MALRLYDKGYITALADAVRAYADISNAMTLQELAASIGLMNAPPAELKLSSAEAQEHGASFATGEGVLIHESHITALADAVRSYTGMTGAMTLQEMAGHMNSYQEGWLIRRSSKTYSGEVDTGLGFDSGDYMQVVCCCPEGMGAPFNFSFPTSSEDVRRRAGCNFLSGSNKIQYYYGNTLSERTCDVNTELDVKKPLTYLLQVYDVRFTQDGKSGYDYSSTNGRFEFKLGQGYCKLFYYAYNTNYRYGAFREAKIYGKDSTLKHHLVPVKKAVGGDMYLWNMVTNEAVAVPAGFAGFYNTFEEYQNEVAGE